MTSETRTPGAAGPAGSADYVEGFQLDDESLLGARARAGDLGASPVTVSTGGALRFLAATAQARAVVEIGTGAGVSGLYLLRGMVPDGVLTTIDIEPEFQRAARQTFVQSGLPSGRTRLIMGRALDVLPRLTAGGYDLVFVDAAKLEYPNYYEHGVQLLRPGGVIVFHNVLAGGRVGDPTCRDPETLALREVIRGVREDDRLIPSLLPVGSGLLVATSR